MNFKSIKLFSTLLSVVLWVLGARVWFAIDSLLSFLIIAVLALLAQLIGVNAAYKEGKNG